MADISIRKVDNSKIQNGGWVGAEYGTPIPGWDDLCLRVRGYESSTYRLCRAVKAKSIRTEDHEQGEINPDVNDRLFREALNETILLDWKNLSSGKKELKHTKELQGELVLDPDNKPFRDAIDYAAVIIGNERKKAAEAVEKN